MRSLIIITAARQAFDIGGLYVGGIRVRFMRAFQRFIRETPIAIARHARQEKIGLPFARVLGQNAINHGAGFFAPAKTQQHARMHDIKRAVALAELARAGDNGDGGFDIAGINQKPHQIIQRILILGLEFKGFQEACARGCGVIQGALHAPQQAP